MEELGARENGSRRPAWVFCTAVSSAATRWRSRSCAARSRSAACGGTAFAASADGAEPISIAASQAPNMGRNVARCATMKRPARAREFSGSHDPARSRRRDLPRRLAAARVAPRRREGPARAVHIRCRRRRDRTRSRCRCSRPARPCRCRRRRRSPRGSRRWRRPCRTPACSCPGSGRSFPARSPR